MVLPDYAVFWVTKRNHEIAISAYNQGDGVWSVQEKVVGPTSPHHNYPSRQHPLTTTSPHHNIPSPQRPLTTTSPHHNIPLPQPLLATMSPSPQCTLTTMSPSPQCPLTSTSPHHNVPSPQHPIGELLMPVFTMRTLFPQLNSAKRNCTSVAKQFAVTSLYLANIPPM